MIHLIDRLFAGWAPHDIMWYSWCIMACLILFVMAIVYGVRQKHKEHRAFHPQSPRHASDYDFTLEVDDES